MACNRQSSILDYFCSHSKSKNSPEKPDQIKHTQSKYFKNLEEDKVNEVIEITDKEDGGDSNSNDIIMMDNEAAAAVDGTHDIVDVDDNINGDDDDGDGDKKDNFYEEKQVSEDDTYVAKLKDKNFIKVDNFLEIVFHDDFENENDATKSKGQLQNDYKLQHFRNIIDTVLIDEHYMHLFDENDWKAIYNFTNLSYQSQALYLRLLIRKSHWIRINQMKYFDIDDIPSKLKELIQNELIITNHSLNDVHEALNILDLNEIRELVKRLKMINVKSSSSKTVIIEAITKHIKQSQPINFGFKSVSINQLILQQIKQLTEFFKVNSKLSRVYFRIFLLYFPLNINDEENGYNIGQELFNLSKLDREEIRYPPYEINKKTIVFPKREHLILFEDSCNLESELFSLIESKNRDKIVHNFLPLIQSTFDSLPFSVIEFDQNLASYLRRFTAGHVLVRSLSMCVSVFEQLKMYTQACSLLEKLLEQKIYCQDHRGRWFERLILNLNKHLKKPNEAIPFLKSALNDNEVRGGHRYSLYQSARKVYSANKLTLPAVEEYHFELKQISIFGSVLKEGIEKRKFIFVADNLNGGLDMLNVEEVALRHYQSLGYISGVHCEGIIFHTLLGLLFWDIIYLADQSTQDAFHSPFQSIPLDLNSDYFYSRRHSLIHSRLKLIKSMSKPEMIEMIETNWYKFEGCSSLVDWERCSLTLLQEIIECVDFGHLAAICERLLKCFRFHRSGFPDLLIWNIETKQIKAVEVKGPGDQLSAKQSLWLNYMQKIGFDAEVCFVKPQEGCSR